MRRLSMSAFLAVPLLLLTGSKDAVAGSSGYEHFGIYGCAFKIFPHIHQHGPLFNYGPYYGYYPFQPYGPWDAYLRYDPFFYGDPYANWNAQSGNYYHKPQLLGGHSHSGFFHASWLHGGWFRGHTWLSGSHGHHAHKGGCSSCGGVASAAPVVPSGDATVRYSGFGTPTQSAVFYSATPTLDPVLDLVPTAGRAR